MTLRIHNTLTRRLEPFEPLEPGSVRMYGCGPTVYDYAHIGNFRSFLVYDLVHRYLEWKGFRVRFVMNYTDVDDKTIEGAAREGVSLERFTERYVRAFEDDWEALGLGPPDVKPRATRYVPEMVRFVERLVERGLAYRADDGSVYFAIGRFPEYGKLSGVRPDRVRPGARVAVDEYGKEDARDFALWKAAKPLDREVGAVWESPWGEGRPGWHLECSVMGVTELGESFDLHLGGEDLIFPHHEDEIAQAEGATGKPFARYWLHVKHLVVEGEKMAKSAGNFFTVREILDRGVEPAALRHLLLGAHYRSELNFTFEGLEASGRAVQRLVDFEERLRQVREGDGAPETGLIPLADRALERFEAALDDDLNTAEAFAALFVLVAEANRLLDRSGERAAPGEGTRVLEAVGSMDRVLGVLSLALRAREVDPETRAWIARRIEERAEARRRRDFAAADRIRDELEARGIVVEDTPGGTRWKRVPTGRKRAGSR